MLNKILINLLLLLGLGVKAQTIDTLANAEINLIDNKVYSYFWSGLDTAYHGTDIYIHKQLLEDKLEPELSNYIDVVKHDYVKSVDTLVTILYQNKSQTYPLNVERFIIQTKHNSYFPTLNELSPAMQQSLYLFGEKIKENIRKGYYYEN